MEEIRPYIDWTPFFQTWMLAGRYPKIFNDSIVGVEAKKLFADAQLMLDKLVKEKKLKANGVVAFYPANAVGDDVVLNKEGQKVTLNFLRQQNKKAGTLPNFCLADFVAPVPASGSPSASHGARGPGSDYIGMFAVTTGLGIESILEEYKKGLDDS